MKMITLIVYCIIMISVLLSYKDLDFCINKK